MFTEFLNKLQRYNIRIKKAVEGERHGNFHSVFRGSGIEFSDVRPYQYGDDVRMIDWNITAKGHGPYLKMFQDEKEQTVFFILDVSGSQSVGALDKTKLQAAKEICGVLVFSTMKEASQLGLLTFTDGIETYLRPRPSAKYGFNVLTEIFKSETKSTRTNIAKALGFARRVLTRRSLLFLISDFIDEGYEFHLKALAKKHDVVVIQLFDPSEKRPHSLGIVETLDPESGRRTWVNTTFGGFPKQLQNSLEQRMALVEGICRHHNANYVAVDATKDYIPALIQLFKIRRFGSKTTHS